jgi:uncharacterized protein YndB with AHSA1/START domain
MASEDAKNTVKDKVEDVTGNGSKGKEALVAAAVSAVGALAASKGPDLVRKVAGAAQEKSDNEAEEMGQKAVEGAKKGLGSTGPAGKVASKLLGSGGGDDKGKGGGGGKKTRRLPIQRWTDVAAPIDDVYEAWTKFDQFPRFMHRVLNVEQKGQDKISWSEKIWFSSRQWEGRVTERRKNERIVWKTNSGMNHKGVVSFHKLAPNLTRVMITMEFEPNGMVEKMASGLRFVKRAVQADLARFKAYVEMEQAKGIEYRPNPEGEEGEKGEDDDQQQEDADEPTSRDEKSDEEREQERKEREKGRQERRKSGSRH